MSRYIKTNVERRLIAESMGRCMNPTCPNELFSENGDIIEKAHIDPYYNCHDNSFDNLVILCPVCHKRFDKNKDFTIDVVREWKRKRREELEKFFSNKYNDFADLKKVVAPLLEENKRIYENYYLGNNKELWDKFEVRILINNRKMKALLEKNIHLIQDNSNKNYSNRYYVQKFLMHIDEFEATRLDDEKNRQVLFPKEINSIFGIAPIRDSLLPLTEAYEDLLKKLKEEKKLVSVHIGIDDPYYVVCEQSKNVKILFSDVPQLRQFLYRYGSFKRAKVRFEPLNFALQYIRNQSVKYHFVSDENIREIIIDDSIKMIFVYEYCLNIECLRNMCPEEKSVIVNLHNWNSGSCISKEAYDWAKNNNIIILDMDKFYEYIKSIRRKKF